MPDETMSDTIKRKKLRRQLEESRRLLAKLPAWIRECPPDFGPVHGKESTGD